LRITAEKLLMNSTDIPLTRLIIAAPISGSGKTTIAAGLIGAFAARGLSVAPFKCGPDYIDPSYHALAAGRPCANLDAWMLPPGAITGMLARHARGADLALIEGVMGLFDGYAGDDTGSTARVARMTDTPVLLVLDVRAMAGTAAALVAGALPGRSVMTPRLTLGYRTVQALGDSWLWRAGETLPDHEFHYSTWERDPDTLPRLYAVQLDALRPDTRTEGAHTGNLLASYVHLHFLAMPE
jgi:cobyrinic acid a,c-diamide synthase